MRQQTLFSLSAFLVVSCLLIGCGGDEAPAPGGTEAAEGETTAAAAMGTAKVMGTVQFNGTAPERPTLNLDRECMALHDGEVHSQHVVVNDNNTLQYVFVYVKEGLEGQSFPTPSEPVVLDQQGCMYEPHVFGVQTGQSIKILNSDPFLHNIHALPEDNRSFNFGMPNAGMEREQSFRVPEVMVRIKCDVHPWMQSYAGVLSHPFYSTTGDDGGFSLDNLPAGEYVIEAWHEEFGTKTQTVTVGDGETANLDFTFGDASV